ncbi:aldo/keto reductase [Salsipaludibacter albus]|uniref:aldo/keto reductase n=1 Tax=Salsipaludibacter albus TaxID=2849650 RepID=UPI001EE4090D|nr:aldo/keto reductase [Salsipaludibacter albus]MBY5164076.1 aldo/keto reductase [Salsipaludibacter albus]
MEYRLLGPTGLAVSRLALGTMTFGDETPEEAAHDQLDMFVEAGGTLIDTADVYSTGVSEEIVGRWLADRPGARERVVVATKGRFPMDDTPTGVGLSRRHLHDALEASLRRLGVDTIDLYQAHAWDPLTPIDETLRFVDDAVSAGKIHHFGVSNFTGWQLVQAIERSEGMTPPVSLQPQYNLLVRDIEHELVPACDHYDIGILPWSPLGGGWLTGKYDRDETPSGATRLGEDPERGMEAYAERNAEERTWAVVDAVRSVADDLDRSMAEVALAWLADQPMVTSVILGARTVDQLEQNLAMADLHLSDDHLDRLTEASEPIVADYPYGGPGRDQRDRRIAGDAG